MVEFDGKRFDVKNIYICVVLIKKCNFSANPIPYGKNFCTQKFERCSSSILLYVRTEFETVAKSEYRIYCHHRYTDIVISLSMTGTDEV